MGCLNPLSEYRLDEDLFFWGSKGYNYIIVDIESEGVEAQEEGYPAQVGDDRLFVFQHPGQDVILVGLGIIVTDEEDGTVGEGPYHQETSDVLVVGVEGCLSGVVLSDEHIRGQGVHVLGYQGGDYP